MRCFHLIVSGKVQGVFFRDNTRKKAMELGLTGYVKNLPDGNVEVVLEGIEYKIKELIDFIKGGPGYAKVTDIRIQKKFPVAFKTFEVRY